MRTRDRVAAPVLLAIGVCYAALTSRLPTRAIENTTDPSFFPWVIAVSLLTLSAALLVRSFASKPDEAPTAPGRIPVRALTALALAVVYLTLLPSLGFLLANIPFFAGLMILYGERRPAWIVAGSLGVSVVLFYLFREVFRILLPGGVIGSLV